VLFDATIEENLRLAKHDVTNTEMINACKMANAHTFISGLPKVSF
jgi:ABC-type multidrug transport system fused ATPase/permease subunit